MQDARPDPSVMSGVIPYLGLAGRAAEALAFYGRAFAATATETMADPADASRLMHGQCVINGGALMLTDHGMADAPAGGPMQGGHLQLVVADGRAWWDRALAAGCTIEMPYERQFWGDDWGLLRDPFGVRWAVLQPGPAQEHAQASKPPHAAHELRLTRLIAAPRAVLWRCWTEPDLLKQWFCPKPWRVSEAVFDLRPGGRMMTVMAGPDGQRVEGDGVWLVVEPMRRLMFTDSFTEGFAPAPSPFLTSEVLFEDAGQGGTTLTWIARHASAEATERHRAMGWEEGWGAAVNQLDALAKGLAAGGRADV